MNLYTGKEQANIEGHNTVVNNNIGEVVITSRQNIGWIFINVLCWLTVIGGIILWILTIEKRNHFRRMQLEINNAASNIDVQLQKRSSTLIKLVDSVKNYATFEKEILTKVTELRSGNNKSVNETNQELDTISKAINISVEQYPDLKTDKLVQTLMQESSYIEKEIAAQRRLYNQYATSFNQEIWIFPWMVIASKAKMETVVLFEASIEAKKDIAINF